MPPSVEKPRLFPCKCLLGFWDVLGTGFKVQSMLRPKVSPWGVRESGPFKLNIGSLASRASRRLRGSGFRISGGEGSRDPFSEEGFFDRRVQPWGAKV